MEKRMAARIKKVYETLLYSVPLDFQIQAVCKNFADMVVDTNKDCYAKRNQTDIEKIKHDIFIGKLGEWGVYFIYLERGHKICPPDMNIYSVKDKSYDADLKFGLFNLHIKSQTFESSQRFGHSWMFQANDPVLIKPNEYDIFIGCNVFEDFFVEIKLERKFEELIIGEPKLKKLIGIKKSIYLKEQLER